LNRKEHQTKKYPEDNRRHGAEHLVVGMRIRDMPPDGGAYGDDKVGDVKNPNESPH